MPIPAFNQALHAFQARLLSFDALCDEAVRALSPGRMRSGELLAILDAHHADNPLPDEIRKALVRLIAEWPEDPTIAATAQHHAPAAGQRPVQVGDVLQGRFKLVELAGEGGTSRVFKAVDLRRYEAGLADPHVAVKVLTESFLEDAGSLATVQREAQKLQRLVHPHIVRVFDCDRDAHTVFMTMEYLHGRSLQRLLREARGPLPSARCEALLSNVCDALEHAHQQGVVHGDLKPANILVTEQGAAKLVDFGIAPRAFTARYASPERAAGGPPTQAGDVYAFACIAYEVFTGEHPMARADGAGPPPRADLPEHRYAAIAQVLAATPPRRPTVRTLFDALYAAGPRTAVRRWAFGILLAVPLLAAGVFGVHERRAGLHADAVRSPTSAPAAAVPASGTVLRDCATCPLMTVLPARGAAPPLAMSTNEITVGEYRQFASATGRRSGGCNVYDGAWSFQAQADWQAPGFGQSEMHPVTCVSWDDAVAYTGWLTRSSGHAYRLPSAAEWEFAALAGAVGTPWGAEAAAACRYANVADASAAEHFPGWKVFPCNDGYVATAPVGSFKPNAFGLNDLLGNVFEWLADCWRDGETAAQPASAVSPAGCEERELRGGSWFSAPEYVAAASRNRFAHDYRSSSVGFRVVREIGS